MRKKREKRGRKKKKMVEEKKRDQNFEMKCMKFCLLVIWSSLHQMAVYRQKKRVWRANNDRRWGLQIGGWPEMRLCRSMRLREPAAGRICSSEWHAGVLWWGFRELRLRSFGVSYTGGPLTSWKCHMGLGLFSCNILGIWWRNS